MKKPNISDCGDPLKKKKGDMEERIRKEDKPKTLEIMDKYYSLPENPGVPVPVVRNLYIGEKLYEKDNIVNYVSLPRGFIHDGYAYVFYQMPEDSQMDADVYVGNYALIQVAADVRQGALVVIAQECEAASDAFRYRFVRMGNGTERFLHRMRGALVGEVVGCFQKF